MSEYFVATTGSNSNPGTTGSPWLTLAYAFSTIAAGDTIKIKSGTYAGGTCSKNANILPDTGATVIIQPTASYSTAYSTASGAEYPLRLLNWTAGSVGAIQLRHARYQWGAGLMIENCHGTGPGATGGNSIVITDVEADHNHSYGIHTRNSDHFDLIRPNCYKNDTGLWFTTDSAHFYVEAPVTHDNDQLVNAGRGGNGMGWYRAHDFLIDGLDPSGYTGGLSYNNRCVSPLYTTDGGHFEQYESYNYRITRMRGWESQNIIETGQSTPTGFRSDGAEIDHCIFYATDSGYAAPLVSGARKGMVLRAMENGRVHHNTIDSLTDQWIIMNTGDFRGSVVGLDVDSNISYGPGSGRLVFIDSGASVTFDYNDLFNPGGTLGYRAGDQTHGINLDPLFVDRANHDYHLTTDSPCIGAGL